MILDEKSYEIRMGIREHVLVAIVYRKSQKVKTKDGIKIREKKVKRIIAPYEIKDGYVYASDKKDKFSRIKSFKYGNIVMALRTRETFEPNKDWLVKDD